MKLFLQILSVLAVIVLLGSYLGYRRCLRRDYAEERTPEELKHEARICLIIMFAALAVVVTSTLLLRNMI